MPQQNGLHGVVRDPVEADLRVDLRGVIRGEEPIAVEASRCHEYEDAEGRIAEPEPLWPGLCEQTNYQVYPVDVVLVDAPELLYPHGIIRQLLEGFDRREAEHLAELVVSGHAEFSGTQDIRGPQIHEVAVGPLETLEEAREVVQGDRAGMGDA